MGAGSEALQNSGRRSTAAGKSQGITGVLEGCDGSLEVIAVWVARTGVFVGTDGTTNSSLGEGGGERDGLDDSAGGRVQGSAGVNC